MYMEADVYVHLRFAQHRRDLMDCLQADSPPGKLPDDAPGPAKRQGQPAGLAQSFQGIPRICFVPKYPTPLM